MKTLTTVSASARIAGFFFAVLMSATVLGTTVMSMQAGHADPAADVIALERVVITAPTVN